MFTAVRNTVGGLKRLAGYAAQEARCAAAAAAAGKHHFSTTTRSRYSGFESPDEEKMVRDAVRSLCSEYPGPYWREKDATSSYPTEFVTALGDAGFLSMLIPEEYGGTGSSLAETAVVLEEVHSSGCNGGAAHAQMYVMGTILRHGSEEQRQKWLPQIADGLKLQAFGVSEPNNGTDTLSLETKAVQEEATGDYIINGQKIWTSRARQSDMMVLLARTSSDPEVKRSQALSVFLVDLREAVANNTVQIQPIDAMINHNTNHLFMEDLRVPESMRIGAEGEGFKAILTSMNAERILIGAECIGDGQYFINRAVEYAKERKVFGRPVKNC